VNAELKKRILVAAPPEAVTRLSKALGEEFDLVFCHSLSLAHTLLTQCRFDVILGGMHFDDSRVFDFIRLARAQERYADVPIVCVKAFDGVLPSRAYDGVKRAIRLLGAEAFVDLAEYRRIYGKEEASQMLLDTIRAALQSSCQKAVAQQPAA